MRSWRALIGLLGAVIVGATAPSVALASNHEIKIREIYAGGTADPGAEYIELQMYAAGQNLFNRGTNTRLYDAAGNITNSFTTNAGTQNPPNSASQQRVLIATQAAQTEFNISAGFTLTPVDALSDTGGAVCYTSTQAGSFIDCVSWGDFSGGPLPSATGGNVDPSGIPDGKALSRSIAPGCSTMLEASDDTNKPADWSTVDPHPLNNASTPPEQPCPTTTITKKPKSKTTDKTPTFKFKASVHGSTFKCKVDNGHFASCTSPFTTPKLSKGKHTFRVRATNSGGGVGNTAKATFKVIKRKPHHH
jgi:hypothetical protein